MLEHAEDLDECNILTVKHQTLFAMQIAYGMVSEDLFYDLLILISGIFIIPRLRSPRSRGQKRNGGQERVLQDW